MVSAKKAVAFFLCCILLFKDISAKDGKIHLLNDVNEEPMEFQKLVTDIFVNSLRSYKCIAIICDQIYYKYFQEELFLNLGLFITYFFVLVEEQDDLLSPFPETQEVLNTIKREDCQTYLMVISNGLQMSRLLQFGDRYRVLDTRANFILLHDKRLFEKHLHYLWKRMVNVLFIKEYSGVKKGSDKKAVPWFELSTVPFPTPITDFFIPKRVDIWRQNKFRNGVDLFKDKSSDLQNQTIRVVTFHHMPAATRIAIPEFKTPKSILPAGAYGFSGIEIEILSTVSQAMNFYIDLYEPDNADTEFWGNKRTDGTFSGIFGELILSKADIGLGDFYYTPYILNIMDLSVPYSTECLTFLTPEALTDNAWKTLILPFKPIMWAIVFMYLFFCSMLLYYITKIQTTVLHGNGDGDDKKVVLKHNKVTNIIAADPNKKYVIMKQQIESSKPPQEMEGMHIFGERSNSLLYTFGMVLMLSLPKVPTGWSLRVLIGCYWIYCLLVVVAYRASMTSILAHPAPRVTIDNLQQLIDSQLAVGGWGELNREFFITSRDSLSHKIGEKFELVTDADKAVDRVAMGSFAFYENIFYLKQAAVKRQLRLELQKVNVTAEGDQLVDYKRNLHIMDSCVINMPVSIGLQKNSPIKPRVDKFIRRIIEAGLVKKWLDDVMQSTLNAEVTADNSVTAIMSMRKFFGAIVALFIGYFFSISAFIGEMFYFHRFVKNDPNFDKYSKTIYNKFEK